MARYPGAEWRPLPQNATAPHITPRVGVFHTIVGTLAGTEHYFAGRSGGIESHFGVACPKCEDDGVAADGEIWQWMDTSRRADAQYKANGFAISVETCDHYKGGTYTNPPLSSRQVDSWIRLGNWMADTHAIARRRCPDWDKTGFGYHSMFGAPSEWTPVAGKTCPNPTRIRQFNDIVLPAIVAGRDPEEIDMTPEQAKQLEQIHGVLFAGHVRQNIPIDNLYRHANEIHDALVVPGTQTAEEAFNILFARVRNIERQVEAIAAALPDPAEPPASPSS